jgi:urocanate hydratase
VVDTLEEAMTVVEENKAAGKPFSVGLIGNASDVYQELVVRGVTPDVVSDQTPAHEALMYVPSGLTVDQADQLRLSDPVAYREKAMASMAAHVQAMLAFKRSGAEVFDYGNNLRQQAYNHGVTDFLASCRLTSAPYSARARARFVGWRSPATRKISTGQMKP